MNFSEIVKGTSEFRLIMISGIFLRKWLIVAERSKMKIFGIDPSYTLNVSPLISSGMTFRMSSGVGLDLVNGDWEIEILISVSD